MPNAIRLMLRAITPEARATAASTTIHATVNHSSRNAVRISSARGVTEGITSKECYTKSLLCKISIYGVHSASPIQ